ARHRGVPRRCAAGDLLTRRGRKTELRRVEPARAHLASADLPGARRGGRADLVEAVLAVDDERVVGAELREHARDLVAERGRRHAEERARRATSADTVGMLRRFERSPPVPTISIAPSAATFTATSRSAAAKPAISSTVSPRICSAARNAPSCAAVASPAITDAIVPRAS